MEVYKVSDTYTNLGKVGRTPLHYPETREGENEESQVKKRQAPKSGTLERVAKARLKLSDTERINARQAFELTEQVHDQIKTELKDRLYDDLHTMKDVRVIPPRYV